MIALTVKNPLLAVPLSFISHYFQDLIPHWDYGVSREADKNGSFFAKSFNISLLADFCLSVILMIVLALLFPTHRLLIWGCMVAAASPDLMWAYYRLYLEKIKKQRSHYDPFARLHILVQWSQTSAGALVEIAWAIVGIFIILGLR
ncbi:hypothetical protein BVY00_00825 [bacterium G20]|nr:hypothetical protein BVY00_00825 [bacterium G20]